MEKRKGKFIKHLRGHVHILGNSQATSAAPRSLAQRRYSARLAIDSKGTFSIARSTAPSILYAVLSSVSSQPSGHNEAFGGTAGPLADIVELALSERLPAFPVRL